ncbi:uncharacterized protein BO66DRAFT_188801 [Aspergillus aculeatinus CBS 121060]|uniref:Uncharacterized protein n=1 Tax=Aspergillus aculeatinus CBS 121060 TaxID=1448322 RepID=A0ACD1GXE6_9EURO|nr:hypothetical protein BO66DRAFT_188801 [Aspergillus aculeatinus CBS 121060]RAH66151.1 hypothetical protein BO66DRAFT_188801 [Aspergillus aculeatinus CBS 121060]
MDGWQTKEESRKRGSCNNPAARCTVQEIKIKLETNGICRAGWFALRIAADWTVSFTRSTFKSYIMDDSPPPPSPPFHLPLSAQTLREYQPGSVVNVNFGSEGRSYEDYFDITPALRTVPQLIGGGVPPISSAKTQVPLYSISMAKKKEFHCQLPSPSPRYFIRPPPCPPLTINCTRKIHSTNETLAKGGNPTRQ